MGLFTTHKPQRCAAREPVAARISFTPQIRTLRVRLRVRAAIVGLPLLLLVCGATVPAGLPQRLEAERLHLAAHAGHPVRDASASGRRALLLTGRGWARGRMGAPGRSVLAVRLRASRCGGAPRLVVVVDGRPALSRRIDSRRWTSWLVRRPLRPGRHTIRLRLANPHRRAHCARALRIDRLALRGASRHPPSKPSPPPPGISVPAPGTTWQWQLTTPVDQSVDAVMFDIDLFDNSAGVVAALHARGRHVVCYMSAGSFEPGRPDAGKFPAAIIGRPLDGWPDEHWLDIRRLDLLGPILERRLDLCKAKGFDSVEPDNIDGYANRTGFPLTGADQLRFNRFLAKAAHARGLSIGLKNDLEQADTLEPDFDWALSEQCFQYDECELLAPFTRAGKAVFVAEYNLDTANFCPQAGAAGVMAMRKRLALDAWRVPC